MTDTKPQTPKADARALDRLAHLLGHGLANDGTWDGAADHLDAINAIVAGVRTIPEHVEEDEEDEIQAAEEAADDAAAPWHVLSCEQGSPGVTVYLFRCEDPTGVHHLVAVDQRLAQDICGALEAPTGEDGVYIERPEGWQILATYPAT